MLLVRGKGDKQRLVPLHDRAIEAIAQCEKLASAYSGGKPTQWLFHAVRNVSKGCWCINPSGATRRTGSAV
jgi:integrase/recombinase XerD